MPAAGYAVIYVRRGAHVPLWSAAGGGRLVRRLGARTAFGSPTALSVVRLSGHWAGVTTPYLPNGKLGWVRLDPDRFGAYTTHWAANVDLSRERGELVHGRRVVRRFAVTVGAVGSTTQPAASRSPTPSVEAT